MTRLAMRPGVTRSQALSELDDGELLGLMRGKPCRDPMRSAACEVLVGRYASLVRSCVHRYRDSPEPVEDLTQAGYVGLLKAINNFDPAVGGNLAAYAQPCISGEIKRHFRDKRWQAHVKRSAQELLLQVRRARADLAQELGRSPRDDEIARHLGVGTDDLADARRADMVFHAHSLDAPVGGDEDPACLGDLLGQEDPRVEHTLDMESVHTHWSDLPEREQRILAMRFYGNMTQTEIGERLGISQMHVSRLLARALTYLRSCLLGGGEWQSGRSACERGLGRALRALASLLARPRADGATRLGPPAGQGSRLAAGRRVAERPGGRTSPGPAIGGAGPGRGLNAGTEGQ